jgi:hypothetical protein
MANTKKVKHHVGNYILCIDKTADHSWLRIQSVSSTWVVRYRDDNPMTAFLLQMLENKDYHSILGNQLSMMYTICHNLHDLAFIQDLAQAYKSMVERKQSLEPEYSQEDSDKALETELKRIEAEKKINK